MLRIMTTWILVAHRSGARLFQHDDGGKPPQELWSIDHPEGRLMNREIDTDRPGRYGEVSSTNRSGLTHEQTAKEHVAETFAIELADRLDEGRTANAYDELILVAESSFLGLVKRKLTPATLSKVTKTFDKDLAHVPVLKLKQHLIDMTEASAA
jgi:protein required for attachment to host cells